MPARLTIFPYQCSCGKTDYWKLSGNKIRCPHCDSSYPISSSGVISFFAEKNEQNEYFDSLYRTGYAHVMDKFKKDKEGVYQRSTERAEEHLKLCGFDMAEPLDNLSILDVACGIGWISAGLMQDKKLTNCKIHAYDISPDGLVRLSKFTKTLKSTNRLELSLQNAENMKFGDATFDVIIGSSVLHHFDNYEGVLKDCHRIMKPGGIAIFGEPFALGYGLGAAALKLAQADLGTSYREIDDNYADIAYCVKSPRDLLKHLVDKHVFFQSEFQLAAQEIGFSSVKYVSAVPREFYRDLFVQQLLLERGISDDRLAERANTIYRLFYDIFDNERFVNSIASFIYIVLRS